MAPTLVKQPLRLLTDWRYFNVLAVLVLAAEVVLGSLIILKVKYTEIDWIAYMQEVGGYQSGELDYTKLRGGTGPLVYPAGFVYIYAALKWLTDDGVNVLRAQWIFLGLYVTLTALALAVYKKAARGAFPPWVVVLFMLSKRVHSIFMLRLFNDGISILLMYVAILLLLHRQWLWGCVWFSLGISVKMNILLFLPALGVILLRNTGIVKTALYLIIAVAVQLLVGVEFLATYPQEYLRKAFELSRVFFFKWTVNWKFLPEEVFIGKPLAHTLLACTLVGVLLFAAKWCRAGGLGSAFGLLRGKVRDSPRGMLFMLFSSQLVGVVFSRTLHYQFYCWYFHTLPFLLWHTRLHTVLRLAILLGIEVAFNVFPATPWSSGLLQGCHLLLLAATFVAPDISPDEGMMLKVVNDNNDDLKALGSKAGLKVPVEVACVDSEGVVLQTKGGLLGAVTRHRVAGKVDVYAQAKQLVCSVRDLGK